MTSYTFVNNFNQVDEEPTFTSFYQIASFVNPKTNKYHVRKFVINNKNEFVNVKEYNLSNKQYVRFFNKKKPNEYKLFAVYNLSMVNPPSMAEILISKSDILAVNSQYYGFAPF